MRPKPHSGETLVQTGHTGDVTHRWRVVGHCSKAGEPCVIVLDMVDPEPRTSVERTISWWETALGVVERPDLNKVDPSWWRK